MSATFKIKPFNYETERLFLVGKTLSNDLAMFLTNLASVMKNTLFKQYGYCEIPMGTTLYRMGNIDEINGAFFSLHPNWAINHRNDLDKTVRKYRITSYLQVLFLISHLAQNGSPKGAIKNLYDRYIQPSDIDVDDVALKFENKEASRQLREFLTVNDIPGWLSSMEDQHPLEVFLIPKYLSHISLIESGINRRSSARNSLKDISIFPPDDFQEIAKVSTVHFYDYLTNKENLHEDEFSIFEKLFIK